MNASENPNAFPLNDEDVGHCHGGMSLLDYFAGQALAAIATDGGYTTKTVAEAIGVPEGEYMASVHWPMFVAIKSYNYAVAMLSERTKRLNAHTRHA